MSFVSIVKGVITGALVGGILATITGGAIGGVLGSLASLTSLGSATIVRNETVRLASYGALTGVAIGSIVGVIITIVAGKVNGVFVGSVTGAVILAFGGMMVGSITSNGQPVNMIQVITLTSFGLVVGGIVGGFLGWLINLPFRLFS